MGTKNQLTSTENEEVTYQVNGQDVKLSRLIVRKLLVKGDGSASDIDISHFINICKYNKLNPFIDEAFLVTKKGQPTKTIVTKEALMKRAETCENYKGTQAGVIIIRENEIQEPEGCFYLATDKLVGGWAKVYRSDRKFPVVARVNLNDYDKKQTTWNEKKSTMISKVAKVQALREAFPAQLGAMYTQEESATIAEDVNQKTVVLDDEPSKAPEESKELEDPKEVIHIPKNADEFFGE